MDINSRSVDMMHKVTIEYAHGITPMSVSASNAQLAIALDVAASSILQSLDARVEIAKALFLGLTGGEVDEEDEKLKNALSHWLGLCGEEEWLADPYS